jgi:RNA polymerase sigma-70 factor, ECF subfamily
VPPASRLAERLDDVCTVLYLIFNQGYAASSGSALVRIDLCEEAIRLTRVLDTLLPAEPEVLGLLALMLFTHARHDARADTQGELVTLEDQDRSRWDRAMIGEARALLARAARHGRDGPFQLSAAIAAMHCKAASAAQTDWPAIALFYDRLLELADTPVVALNRAVAIGLARSPAEGLSALEVCAAGGRLDEYHPYHVALAELSVRAGDRDAASRAFERALTLTQNERQRDFLRRKIGALKRAPSRG